MLCFLVQLKQTVCSQTSAAHFGRLTDQTCHVDYSEAPADQTV